MRSSAKLGWLILITVFLCSGGVPSAYAAEDGSHPHHVAAVVGVARHNGKNSEAWGVDYAYTFDNNVFVQGFYEQVRGEFNISAFGALIGKHFGHGWQAGIGPGVETKLKSGKNLFLIRTTVAYDWHIGSWSIGPGLTYDLIEDASDTVYLGVAVGYGF